MPVTIRPVYGTGAHGGTKEVPRRYRGLVPRGPYGALRSTPERTTPCVRRADATGSLGRPIDACPRRSRRRTRHRVDTRASARHGRARVVRRRRCFRAVSDTRVGRGVERVACPVDGSRLEGWRHGNEILCWTYDPARVLGTVTCGSAHRAHIHNAAGGYVYQTDRSVHIRGGGGGHNDTVRGCRTVYYGPKTSKASNGSW